MEFRQAARPDLDAILAIIRQAQEYFRSHGIDQWQNGYPDRADILRDIANGSSRILLAQGRPIATAAVSFGGEPTYDAVYGGQWLSNGAFAVVHRIAVEEKHKGAGAASFMLGKIERLCLGRGVPSIKVDTHEDNRPMQRLLQKNRFIRCGLIYLSDGSRRIAFEKLLGAPEIR